MLMEDTKDGEIASSMKGIQKRVEEVADAYERMAKYLILTNGGGAVATSAFLGSTMKSGHSAFEVLPLLCFYAGLIVAGLMVFGDLTLRWTMIEEDIRAREMMLKQNKIIKYVALWAQKPAKIIIISYSCLIAGGVLASVVGFCLLW
jgi:hypothetical protein